MIDEIIDLVDTTRLSTFLSNWYDNSIRFFSFLQLWWRRQIANLFGKFLFLKEFYLGLTNSPSPIENSS